MKQVSEERSCGDKRRYTSRRQAARVAGLMNRDNADYDTPLQPYKCLFGRHWHIGHRMKHPESRHTKLDTAL